MRVPEYVMDHVDFITAIASILGALACGYLALLTKKETHPWAIPQMVSLVLLGAALFANGLYVFPEWALINGHRPTGLLVESAAGLNMIVMAARGHLKNYGRNGEHQGSPSP